MTDPTKLNTDYSAEILTLSEDFLFSTTEGEGEHVGKNSIFLRMSGCNLTCKSFASPDAPYGCDSFISWSVKNKMTFQAIWDDFFVQQGFKQKLEGGYILKLTGGEPLINQKQLRKFLEFLKQKMGTYPRVDFETNATITPDEYWVEIGATFTTSPKLSTNGDPESKTYKPEVLKWHRDHNSGFKFVITCSEDIDEIWRKYVIPFNLDKSRIWFMPACGSRQEHIERAPAVVEYAKAMFVNFSPRLHLLIYDQALKV